MSFSRACTGTAPQEEQAAEPPRWTPCPRRGPRRKGRCPETPPPETDARPAAHRGTHRRGTGEGHRRARAREMAPRPSSPSALIRAAGSRLGRGSPEAGSGVRAPPPRRPRAGSQPHRRREADPYLCRVPRAGRPPRRRRGVLGRGCGAGGTGGRSVRQAGPRAAAGQREQLREEPQPGGGPRGGAGRGGRRPAHPEAVGPGSARASWDPGAASPLFPPGGPGSGAGVSVTTAGSGRAREKGAIERHKATFPGPRYRP